MYKTINWKLFILTFGFFFLVSFLNAQSIGNYIPQNGDIIFHQSKSSQSPFIKLATKSKYTHCGIIYIENGKAFVLEASRVVKKTALEAWENNGIDKKFIIKRLNNAAQVITPTALQKMKSVGKSFLGKLYDKTFEWSDDKIYCSELVWKIYDRALGIKIGEPQPLKSFDISNIDVQRMLKKRYPVNIPYDELVISPSAMFDSKSLIKVSEH